MTAVATDGALAVRGLEVRYHGALALGNVNLEIPRGARVGIVGRNGAGKSSLLRAIAGIVPCAKGTIEWDGADITRMRADRRVGKGIAMIPEGRRVFGGLSVANNLRVGSFVDGKHASERLEQVYRLFPILKERAQLPAAQLSGGEAQMLAIGEALMSGPRLLLLDEPSIGLAPIVVANVLATIRELSERGISVLLVEQSVRLASSFADELHVLDMGRMAKIKDRQGELDEEKLREAYLGGR
ncbi:MAG TPA: ABC transporter ATP-binding protein [Candidatus Eisenbacteria bacterium]|nr:ABC transporter ATP-binding protein [Candidatus Eisenbacteria bacterium]